MSSIYLRKRSAALPALTPVLALAWLLATAASALAISAPIHIHGTGGEGVYIRPEPNTSRPPVGWMPEGASPDFNCFAWGQNIGGVPIWFNVNYGGVSGYYASYYDDSSYHSNEELTAKYGVPLCGSAPPAPSPSPPPAPSPTPEGSVLGGGAVYTIVDANGGVYFRNSPKWSDTPSTPGSGVYTGDQVQLICGASGEAYGPYSNHWWSYVANLTRPGAGKGWVNAHFINDGMPADQPSPGEGTCPAGVGGAPAGGGSTPVPYSPKSAFFWPNVTPFLSKVADKDFKWGDWVSGGCDPSPPAGYSIPGSVNTLAGWSVGRLGPMYFMRQNPGRWSQIHTIILFDPGSYGEMTGPNGCDSKLTKPSINEMLAKWLQHDGNELLILAGSATEEKEHQIPHSPFAWGKPLYTGLWNVYFHDLWHEPAAVRARAVVCDYDNLGHDYVLNYFYPIVQATGVGFRPNGCPTSAFVEPPPVRWSP